MLSSQDLLDTMGSLGHCVGLAAPQLGELVRVVAVDVSEHPKAETNNGLLVLANPRIVEADGSEVGREGCLSIPDLTANVRRATSIVVEHLGGRVTLRGLRGALRTARARSPRRDPLPGPRRVAGRRRVPAADLRVGERAGRLGLGLGALRARRPATRRPPPRIGSGSTRPRPRPSSRADRPRRAADRGTAPPRRSGPSKRSRLAACWGVEGIAAKRPAAAIAFPR